jgi:hypothetical protein
MKPLFALLLALAAARALAQPLKLHPANPHYFWLNGKPAVLVGSTEHYGAVLNADFDYIKYLNTIAADGLNLTRVFTGSYVERPGDFGIANNTLAPKEGRFLCPWARSAQPGYVLGGHKFDLDRWDEAYFARLKDFMAQAAQRGVVVELVMFSSHYGGWANSPMNPRNNVNLPDSLPLAQAQTLANGPLLAYQEKMVRKLVRELNGFDNLYFEVQNEPYADHPDSLTEVFEYIEIAELKHDWMRWQLRVDVAKPASLAWQARVAEWIANEEQGLPKRHLIAQNYQNYTGPVAQVHPAISIINFHYALPQAVAPNYAYNRPIGFDESGFAGPADYTYRRQAWQFMLAGGAAWHHLDYSFATGQEDGTARYPAPGGGSPALRRQFGVMKRFLEQFNLPKMRPEALLLGATNGFSGQCLAGAGQYAVYLAGRGAAQAQLPLPQGRYRAEWVDTLTGQTLKTETFAHAGGPRLLPGPTVAEDVALRVVRQ